MCAEDRPETLVIDIHGEEKRTTMMFTSEVADIAMVGRMFLAEHEIGRSIYRCFSLAVNVTASDGSLLWSRARGIISVDAP